jgi:cysteinyl-tRNA synthetase
MALVLYDTMSKKKEVFTPLHPTKVGMYVCGVTVDDHSHIGHAKSAINFDLIVRWLRYRGYDVQHVTNFTDVDDKIIAKSRDQGIEPLQLAERIIEDYFRAMDSLKVKRASVYPRASQTMPEIIEMIIGLVDKGYAYESQGSVYFSVRKAKEYGKLSGQSLDQMESGARIDPGEDKRDPMDFALWKAAKPDEISWDSPWGKGRPGWHIECSAMCLKHIGKTVDIHGGGTELVFPHHENEILQSEALNGVQFVKYWMHNGLLLIDQEKMSKSLKNFFTIGDVLKKFSPETVRFFILNASYRQPLDYDEKSLDEARKALDRLQNTYDAMRTAAKTASGTEDAVELCQKSWRQFEERMDDDFSSREAVAVMYDLARDANRLLSDGRVSRKGAENVVQVLDKFNAIFDVLTALAQQRLEVSSSVNRSNIETGEIETLLAKETLTDGEVERLVIGRDAARKSKDFALADRIRKRLADLGIEVQDTSDGAVWKRK